MVKTNNLDRPKFVEKFLGETMMNCNREIPYDLALKLYEEDYTTDIPWSQLGYVSFDKERYSGPDMDYELTDEEKALLEEYEVMEELQSQQEKAERAAKSGRPWYYTYVYLALFAAIIYSIADWAWSNLNQNKGKTKRGKGKKSN